MFLLIFCSPDSALDPAYKDGVAKKTFTDSAACKTAYAAYNCIMIASAMSAAPCDASGAPMLPCYDLCTTYVLACKFGGGISTMSPSSKYLAFFPALLPEAPLSNYAQ